MRGGKKKKPGTPATAILAGAGLRGAEVYGAYALAHPDRLKFIAVADPDSYRRKLFQKEHDIPDDKAFLSWQDLLSREGEPLADIAFICTQDAMHYEPAMTALRGGYNLLLEKPISPDITECKNLAGYPQKETQVVQVGHVLRYTPFWRKVKELVDSGAIGQVVHYEQSENISTWHYGHSYVRGHYSNADESSPLILAKTCHDLDLMFWIIGERAQSVESSGNLLYYREENAPEGAPRRCTDGCPAGESCPWFSPRLYLRGEPLLRTVKHSRSKILNLMIGASFRSPGFFRVLGKIIPPLKALSDWQMFPSNTISADHSAEGRMKALKEGPYGRCIYRCGNDVVDHQVVTCQYPSGITGTLTVHGFSDFEGREIRIFGTKGTIRGFFRLYGEELTITDHRYLNSRVVYRKGVQMDGHGGGDFAMLDAVTAVLLGEKTPEEGGISGLSEALESHFMAFAAEEARKKGEVLSLTPFRE